ncbi:amino acid adenylation domain-containing protein [Psychromonas sp. 14N.309.X.WAT.B.A12]|uniref:non-ribosomal peptide synthetase n=1 Tax=Psychromonas sp. 14N.309.X.WAT.B.A12 TaxID=2998322 RepID=UPI0025B0B2F7|nr:non-ribosomal peptide synthetase [Psychromonas sp. 14N.309.X.WAT.B.A12]MDN2662325.1 amino acid adenylation domain-containing protein [Psychromonas sp. 14N.309.X.WAT.B.A12]
MPNTTSTEISIAHSLPIVGPQLGIWVADQLAAKDNTFAVAQYVELLGDINVERLNEAIKLGLIEADTVHTLYQEHADESVQILQSADGKARLVADFVDLTNANNCAVDDAISIMRDDIAQAPRANAEDNRFRHIVFKLPTEKGKPKWLWYQRYHHLMLDGFSFTALTQRISNIYSALLSGEEIGGSPFTPYDAVVKEYIAYDKSDKKNRDKQFWQDYCEQDIAPSSLSYRQSASTDGLNIDVIREQFVLSGEIAESLGRHVDYSLSDIASTAVFIYLANLTGQQTQCVGYPLMRRMGSQALTTLGTSVNVLPLIMTLKPEFTFEDCIKALMQQIKKIRRHQQYEAEQIQRDLGAAGNKERLYSATLNCKLFDYQLDLAGVKGKTHQMATGPIEDIEFGIYLLQGKLSIELSANATRYNQAELQLHGHRLLNLLAQYAHNVAFNLHPALDSYSMVTSEEKLQLVEWSNGPKVDTSPYGETIVSLLVKQANTAGHKTALVHEGDSLSFEDLYKRVNQLSRLLLSHDVKAGDLVAVAVPRSIDSIISIFAIMNIGAVYLPLDLGHPADRLAMMCEDKIPSLALSTIDNKHLLPDTVLTLCLDDKPTLTVLEACYDTPLSEDKTDVRKQQLAYVFYTSGSTGRPKGVIVSHGALINLISALQAKVYPSVDCNKQQLSVALTGSLSFDTSWDPIILMALGHKLHLYSDNVKQDVFSLLASIESDKIDTLAVAPSLATQLVQAGLCEEGRHQPQLMDICGEPVPPSLWQTLRNSTIASHNIYGPTEFTVYATSEQITDKTPDVEIGKPFANTSVYILDEQLKPVPIGVNGELYLAGDNMSSGYLNRPDITASRFVANPFMDGDVMYMTGDIVRWSAQGQLIFVGRCDNQVKIRGYRIELGDVEAALSCLTVTKEVAVIVEQNDNSQRLLAYCTLNKHQLGDESEVVARILKQLNAVLPSYMVPSVVSILNEMPLTVSGKINKKALPKPIMLSQGALIPKTVKEVLLCQQMASVLDIDSVALDDDFFKMAGDSISAMRLSIALHKQGYELRPQSIFQARTAEKMLGTMKEIQATSKTTQQIVDDQLDKSRARTKVLNTLFNQQEYQLLRQHYGEQADILPTLPLQAGLLFHAQIAGEDSQYSFTTKLSIAGEVDTEQLQQAIAKLIVQHPQLAAQFDVQLTGKALQIIPEISLSSAKQYAPLHTLDFSTLNESDKQSALYSLEMDEAYRVFELDNNNGQGEILPSLLFFNLIKLADKQYELLITAHHLIIDGWSTPILLRDLFVHYVGSYVDDSAQVDTLNARYQDVVIEMASSSTETAKQAWRTALNDVTPTLLYAQSTSDVQELKTSLDTRLSAQIHQYCQHHGVTLNTLIQGVWGLQLGAMCGRDKVVFGSPVSGRFSDVVGIDQQIGLFSNTLPVAIDFNSYQTVLTQLLALQKQQITLMSHDNLGLGEIQRIANLDNLFDTLLVVENYPADQDFLSQSYRGLEVKQVENRGYTHYPLTILVLPGDNIRILFEYRDVVKAPEQLVQRFIQILTQLVNNSEISVPELIFQTEQDQEVICKANQTDVVVKEHSLRNLLQQQAHLTPTKIALKDAQQSFTYQQMRHQVENVATGLLQENNSDNSGTDFIAIAVPRSCELSIALQAVIEIGAAYLPLDSSYPDERLAFMLSDAKVTTLVTTKEQLPRFAKPAFSGLSLNIILIDRLLIQQKTDNSFSEHAVKTIKADDPAYVIYTSGSTGKPKGVVVSHQAIVNRLLWMQAAYQLTSEDVILQKTPSSFDVSVWEFFWPLIEGACLFMAEPEAHRDPQAILDTIISENITTLHFVPSMLATFVEHASGTNQLSALNSRLKRVFCSGEALPIGLVEQFEAISDKPLHNLYGPTEAAVDVTYFPANEATKNQLTEVPIGLPVWNTQLRILDHQLRPVGVDCIGELYLTGQQLANGYLNRPDITADRFVADPQADGQRMYRTGDIAKWSNDGNVIYLGRTDDQLKIRGLRVEIGEIEQALLSFDEIKKVTVDARALQRSIPTQPLQDNRQLVAYYIANNQVNQGLHLNASQMLSRLSESLPTHMIPIALIEVNEFPLSANGKLNKKALPDPEQSQSSTGRKPTAGVEQTIAQAFKKLLNVNDISAQDSFFNLGGHSLMAMKLAVELRASLGLPVSVGQIMVSPTIEELASVLVDETLRNDPEKAGFGHILPIRQGQGTPLICINPGSGFSWQYTGLPKYLEGNYPIVGLQSPRPNGAVAVSEDMEAAVEHYFRALKGVQPQGPYHFLGYSFGGTVAIALAAKLERLGEQVSFVGLLDTYPPEGQEWKRPTEAEAREEVEREKRQFFAAAENDISDKAGLAEQDKMFNDIVANYDDTVRLLSKATTQSYSGKVHLFVAEKTLPEGWDEVKSWAPFVNDLTKYRLPFSHDDILSSEALLSIGTRLSRLVKSSLN